MGRGLQALLPNAGDQPPPPDPADWLSAVDDRPAPRLSALVESGLDLLQRSVGADICAYVHGSEARRPHLWLRSGPGAALGAAEWVELGVAAVGVVLGQVRMPRSLRLGRTELLAVPTRGAGSSGVHLLGRSDRGLTDHERTVAIHLVQAFGEALHGLLPEQEGFEGTGPEALPAPVETPVATAALVETPAAGTGLTPARAPAAVVARWPAPVDLEELVRDAVRASGVRHSELDVRLLAERGADVIDVAAAHRGDRVRVVLPADPEDPAHSATRAAAQTAHLLELIGSGGPPREERAAG